MNKENQSKNSAKTIFASEKSEQSVLGAILIDENALVLAVSSLTEESFYYPAHRQIFSAAKNLFEDNKAVDIITISDYLKELEIIEQVGGFDYLISLSELLPTTSNIEFYINNVVRLARVRTMQAAIYSAASKLTEPTPDTDNLINEAQQIIFDAVGEQTKAAFDHLKSIGAAVIADLEKSKANHGDVSGLSTGYHKLDEYTCGLQPGDMVIIAARPSMGKTAFALDIAENVASKPNQAAAIFSLEMTKKQLYTRLLSTKANLNSQKIRNVGKLNDAQWNNIVLGLANVNNINLYIDDTPGLHPTEMRARARLLKTKHPEIKLIVVDYIQLMHAAGFGSREQEVSYISRSLKAMAKELDVPVIALAQLNRESEKQGKGGVAAKPQLSQLRESGSIEQDADLVMFIYRRFYYTKNEDDAGKANIIIAKQRNGPVGDFLLHFESNFAHFSNPPLEWLNQED